jgi:hypothetical protein
LQSDSNPSLRTIFPQGVPPGLPTATLFSSNGLKREHFSWDSLAEPVFIMRQQAP